MAQVFNSDGSFRKDVKNLSWFKRYTTNHAIKFLEFHIYPETLQKSTGYEGNFVAKFHDGTSFEESFKCIDSCRRVISAMRNLFDVKITVTEPNMKPRYSCLCQNWDAVVYTVIQNMVDSMPTDTEPFCSTFKTAAYAAMVSEADSFRTDGHYHVYGNSKDGYNVEHKHTGTEYNISIYETDFVEWLMQGNNEEDLR